MNVLSFSGEKERLPTNERLCNSDLLCLVQVNVGFSHYSLNLASEKCEMEKRLVFVLDPPKEEPPKKKQKKGKDKKARNMSLLK